MATYMALNVFHQAVMGGQIGSVALPTYKVYESLRLARSWSYGRFSRGTPTAVSNGAAKAPGPNNRLLAARSCHGQERDGQSMGLALKITALQ